MTEDEALASLRASLGYSLNPFDTAIAIRFRRTPQWRQFVTDRLIGLGVPRETIKELMT